MFPTSSSILLTVVSILSLFIQHSRALLSLPSLQPISGFSPLCAAAYGTPIQACPDTQKFSDPAIVCSKECFIALNDASLTIQRSCQTAAAYGSTVISHAFSGDLSTYMCGGRFASSNSGSNKGSTATNVITTAMGTSPTPSPTQSDNNGASPFNPSTVTETMSATTSTASTTLAISTTLSSATQSAATSSESSASLSPSSTSTTGSSSTEEAQPTRRPSNGDSTPFDQGSSLGSQISAASPSLTLSSVTTSSFALLLVSSLFSLLALEWLS